MKVTQQQDHRLMTDVLKGYAEAATPELISRFDNLDCREVYAPVLDLLPIRPVRIADIGAGTGRDAAWFASQGHEVLAVEPVSELREPGMRLHPSERIRWLNDSLPALDKTLPTRPSISSRCAEYGTTSKSNSASAPWKS